MAFLDNSGDIILDAVLTDTGRKRLAQGNGSFRITKFALGDDEIDYGLYDKDNVSGSAYYDINILQTPVLEAFTNNMSSMKSRLLSIARTDILYLPVIRIFNQGDSALESNFGNYVVLVDETTVDALTTEKNVLSAGILNGFQPQNGNRLVRTDQGLDTNELSQDAVISPELLETQYFVQVDNRLGFLVNPSVGGRGGVASRTVGFSPASIDDDNIATYLFTSGDNAGVVSQLQTGEASDIDGPRGTRVSLKLASSLELRTSTFLFEQLGSQGIADIQSGSRTLAAADYRFIDSTMRVSGITTGYTLDIPVRFVKKTS
tara:strand:- start:604 stop:1557 length:954 start_codon:yes stop_codon:yes gene_type:complete